MLSANVAMAKSFKAKQQKRAPVYEDLRKIRKAI